jgi:MFS superfamily sulfate permease-like transporter
MFYANCQAIKKQISGSVQKKAPLSELVIVNLSATTEADLMVVDMFAELYNELQERGVRFRLANASWPVRALLKKIGHEAIYCGVDQPLSIPEILSNRPISSG